MTRSLPLILTLLLWASGLAAQELDLPALTGRVVDRAELLDTQAEARLTGMLAAHCLGVRAAGRPLSPRNKCKPRPCRRCRGED